MKGLEVETWIIQQQFDFGKQGETPITWRMIMVDMMSQPIVVGTLNTPDNNNYYAHQTISYLQYNGFETEDSWIYFGATTYEGYFYSLS